MSTEQFNTTERSSHDKKSEWDRSQQLGPHHQQHAYLLQQNLQQAPQMFSHHHRRHHHLGGGSIETGMFRCPSAATPTFANLSPTIDGCTMQSVQYLFAGHESHRNEADGASISHVRFGMPPLHISSSSNINNDNNGNNNNNSSSNNSNQKVSITSAARPHQARSGEGKAGGTLSMSTPAKSSAPRRMRNSSISPLTVRPTGTKDRHSKVRTAKGLRDRRVRLSAPTAIQFFDVQDRLGYDQPSKAVDWLIKKARAAIDELAPVEGVILGDEVGDTPVHDRKPIREHDLHGSFVKVKDEDQTLAAAAGGGARAESRAKARERARERAKEKTTTPAGSASTTPIETSSPPPAAPTPVQPLTSTNLHLFPEFFMLTSQFRSQFDELHRPPDLSSMLSPQTSAPPPASHLLPYASPFFSASSTMFSGDGPPLQYSAQPIYNTPTTAATNVNDNHTPNSPRGTLQSIFSSPQSSSMQPRVAMPPLMMMGEAVQAQMYGATTFSSVVSEAGQNNNSATYNQQMIGSSEMGSPNLHPHSRISMRIQGMEQLRGSRVEETRITPSSMQAEFQ